MPAEQKKLAPKLRLWLKHFLDETNPTTFMNQTAAAKAAGYKCKTDEAFGAVGYQNFKKLQNLIENWLDEEGLSDNKLKTLLLEGLTAKETRFFAFQGMVVEEKEVIPWEVRRKYLEMAMKVKGMFAPEKHEVTGKGGGAIGVKHSLDDTWKELLVEVAKPNTDELPKRKNRSN